MWLLCSKREMRTGFWRGKPEEKRSVGTRRHRRLNNITINIKEMG
jgi:hypothetical protein